MIDDSDNEKEKFCVNDKMPNAPVPPLVYPPPEVLAAGIDIPPAPKMNGDDMEGVEDDQGISPLNITPLNITPQIEYDRVLKKLFFLSFTFFCDC